MDYVLGWAHSLSTMVVPSWVGEGGRTACVPAIFLAVLVRLVVASVFSIVRVGLGLPVSFVLVVFGVTSLDNGTSDSSADVYLDPDLDKIFRSKPSVLFAYPLLVLEEVGSEIRPREDVVLNVLSAIPQISKP